MKTKILIFAIVATLATVAHAQQVIITFDDLANTAGGANVPNGYQGLNWNNFGYLNGRTNNYNPSGYPTAMASANNVAFNWSGTQASISSPLLPFDLSSAYLTAAYRDNLQLQVLGYVGGFLAYSNTYILSATNSTLINFNYHAVDFVSFNSSGGTPHSGYTANGTQFAMDNLTIVTNPPPSATSLVDNFASDSTLNTNLWATWSSLLNSIAAFGEGGCGGNTLVAQNLTFGPAGMQMAGANQNYTFAGIQSYQAFYPPFTLNATVTGTVANGNPFELFLSNGSWGGNRLAIFGNINSQNCGYYGIWINSVNDGFCAVNLDLFYQNGLVGVSYTIQVSIDAAGQITVSLISNGITLAQQTGSGFTGPFYVVLGQGEGAPCTGGSANVAIWKNINVTPPQATPPQSVSAPTTTNQFNFRSVLFGTQTLSVSVTSVNPITGAVTCNGSETRGDTVGSPPFHWAWGDGATTAGYFPQSHTYPSVASNYVVTVTDTYSDGSTGMAQAVVWFAPPTIKPVTLPSDTAVRIATSPLTLVSRQSGYGVSPQLTYFASSSFGMVPQSTIEYVLSTAAAMERDFDDEDFFLINGQFQQIVMADPNSTGGVYSIWYSSPVAFGAGTNTFSGSLSWSSYFHETGHNFTLNSPLNYYLGGKLTATQMRL